MHGRHRNARGQRAGQRFLQHCAAGGGDLPGRVPQRVALRRDEPVQRDALRREPVSHEPRGRPGHARQALGRDQEQPGHADDELVCVAGDRVPLSDWRRAGLFARQLFTE